MNTTYAKLFFTGLLAFVLNTSCSSDGNEIRNEEPQQIVDTHKFIALRNDGQLFEIGAESGKVTQSNKISGVVFNTIFNTLTTSTNTWWFYEQIYGPIQGFLYIKNRDEASSKRIPIELPEAVYGPSAGVISLDWYEDGQTLIGVVKDNIEAAHGIYRLIEINIETFEVTNYGEIEDLQVMQSTTLVDSNLYISSFSKANPEGFQFQVLNIIDKNLRTMNIPNTIAPPILLSHNTEENELFGFIRRADTNVIQAAYPIIFNPSLETYERLPLDIDISLINVFGKSYYDIKRKQHVALVATKEFYALLKHSVKTGKTTLIPLHDYGDLSSLINIIDVK
ncbi:hypothetical protein [Arenibacter certesii]|nr:hypothetical protein [Arenibacter certesii]